jgi:hypothetical protein
LLIKQQKTSKLADTAYDNPFKKGRNSMKSDNVVVPKIDLDKVLKQQKLDEEEDILKISKVSSINKTKKHIVLGR